MYPAVRSQSEVHLTQDAVSEASGLRCPPDEDMARQEFKADADINVMLSRHGIVPAPPGSYGVHDFSVDLTQARIAVREVEEGYARLPEAVRAKYPSMAAIRDAIAQGEVIDFTGAEESAVVPPAPEATGGGAGAVPPVSSGGAS